MSLFDPFEFAEYHRSLTLCRCELASYTGRREGKSLGTRLLRCESALNRSLYRQDHHSLGGFWLTGTRLKRHDIHPRKFLPLVEMLEAKHNSLWTSLSFSQQKELLTLLEQMKPEEQDCLLRVLHQLMEQSPRLAFLMSPDEQDTLLSLLTQLHSIDRTNLLRLLEPMNLQEQKKLIQMTSRLKQSQEYAEVLGSSHLLRTLKEEVQLNLSSTTYYMYGERVLKLMNKLLPVGLVDGLNPAYLYGLLRVLEQSSRQHELVEMMERLKPQEQLQLLTMLGRVYSPVESSKMVDEILISPMRMSEMIDQFEQQQQLERVLSAFGKLQQKYNLAVHSIDDARLLSKFANLLYLHLPQREGRLSLDRSSLQQCLDKLEPLERKQLPRVLSRLNISGLSQQVTLLYEEELKGVNVRSMLSDAYELLMQMEYESLLQRLLLLFVCLLSVYLSEADPQGGFGNLLLDGWWLEFWEIILLAAGDVERNPGPTFMTEKELAAVSNAIIEEDDLSDIFDNVLPISSKWPQFCSILGLRPSLLDTISENDRRDCGRCLFEGVKHWLRGNYNTEKYGPPTWRKLVAAVDNSAGGNNHALAKTIAEKHKALPTVPPQLQFIDSSHKDRRRFEEMSSSFNSMYQSVVRLLRNVDVGEVKESLCYLTDPEHFDKLCVPHRIYEHAATTKDLLGRLCPQYINPGNTFVLEEIVKKCGSCRCKKLVQEYINKFM